MLFIGDFIPGRPKTKRLHLDESLFEKIGENDMEAFEKLYYLTERTMYAYIFSIVGNHQDTLDILQETYLKIRSAAHLYTPMGKPLAWMFSIARNLHRSKLRSQKKVAQDGFDDMENSLSFSYVSNPDDRLVLEAALKVLSEEERQIVLLYAVSGMKHKEIANSFELPLSTTLSKYHRALKKMKKHLNEQGSFV